MKRDSVVVYRSWLNGVQRLSIERQNGLIRLAIDYGLDGVIPEEEGLDPFTDMFLQMVIPQIDANNRKFVNGCKGGAPKGSRNNPNGRKGNKPRTNQELTNNKPNENDNVNVNENVLQKEKTKKKSSQSLTPQEQDFHDGMKERFPNVMGMKEPLSLEQYHKLLSEFGKDVVVAKLEAMENYAPLRKNNLSANKTIRNWIRRESNN